MALLLAGGQGERLHPLTRDRAKPAVPFGGSYRIVDFTLSNCVNSGLRRVYVLTQYKSLSLDRHLRLAWNLLSEEIDEFIVPVPPQMRLGGSWYRGTADAIFQNIYTLEQDRPRHVVVLSGDHVYKMDYGRMIDFHRERGADLTVACIEVGREEAPHFGVAATDGDGRIVGWQEKSPSPTPRPGTSDRFLASMGVYVFETEVLVRRVSLDAKRDTAHDFGKSVIPEMIGRDRVFAYPFGDEDSAGGTYWRDIGRIDAYHEANLDLLSPAPPIDLNDPAWPIRSAPYRAPPARTVSVSGGPRGEVVDSLIASGSLVTGGRVEHSVLGHGVRVRPGATVVDSVLFDDVSVGEGAFVRGAIVDKAVAIPAGERVGEDPDVDRARFAVTEGGVIVLPKGPIF